MKYRNKALLAGFLLLIVILPLVAVSCERSLVLEVENQTDQTLTMYVNGYKTFSVEPSKTFKHPTGQGTAGYYTVEAKNAEGKIYYSRGYSWDDFEAVDFKIVITQQGN